MTRVDEAEIRSAADRILEHHRKGHCDLERTVATLKLLLDRIDAISQEWFFNHLFLRLTEQLRQSRPKQASGLQPYPISVILRAIARFGPVDRMLPALFAYLDPSDPIVSQNWETEVFSQMVTAVHLHGDRISQVAFDQLKDLASLYSDPNSSTLAGVVVPSGIASGAAGLKSAIESLEFIRFEATLRGSSHGTARPSRSDELETVASEHLTPSELNEDRHFALMAIAEARKSTPEDGKPRPRVGAVVVKDGKVLASAHRGETMGNHAEYIALETRLPDAAVAGATVYTTLEPCTTRNHPKIPCVERIIARKIRRVVIGMLDPDPRITGRGQRKLRDANIITDLFPHDLMAQVEDLNREFTKDRESSSTTLEVALRSGPIAKLPSQLPRHEEQGQEEWDVFISHATEDKEEIARPLAEALRAEGLRVWYDEFSLSVGDSLRKKIDHGLANSQFGVVVLSQHFFEKRWPDQELNGLATREVDAKKVILPVWHGVALRDVRRYSPMLADRVAAITDQGLEKVVEQLLLAMRIPRTGAAAAVSPGMDLPKPEHARWGPLDGRPAGITVDGRVFIPWKVLKREVEQKLLCQLGDCLPSNCTVVLEDFHGRRDWVVRISSPAGQPVGHMWFGSNPGNKWEADGIIRVGDAISDEESVVWQAVQRYSDGSYRRIGTSLKHPPQVTGG